MKELHLTHGCGRSLKVWVKRFRPVEGDVTSYQWTDPNGIAREQPMPCYALAAIEHTKTVINTFINKNLPGYLNAHLGPKTSPMWGVFRLALARAKTRDVSPLFRLPDNLVIELRQLT
jgi:hypothetical protein